MRKADVQALIAASGGRRSYIAYIYVGDYPADGTFGWETSAGLTITSVGNTIGTSVRSFDINHSAIPFKNRVFIQKYSVAFLTADNDESSQYWVIDPEPSINRT